MVRELPEDLRLFTLLFGMTGVGDVLEGSHVFDEGVVVGGD